MWNTFFALDDPRDAPIETIHLREEIASGDTAARRDIFSIDNLVVQFGDELAGSDSGDAGDGAEAETIYVGPGSTTAPHYTFYSDEAGVVERGHLFSILTPITSLSGWRCHIAPILPKHKGKKQNSSRNITSWRRFTDRRH